MSRSRLGYLMTPLTPCVLKACRNLLLFITTDPNRHKLLGAFEAKCVRWEIELLALGLDRTGNAGNSLRFYHLITVCHCPRSWVRVIWGCQIKVLLIISPTLPARSRPGLWPAIVVLAVVDRLLLRIACQHRHPPCHQGRLKEKPSELPSDFITVQFAALWCRTFYFPPCCLLLHGKNVDQCFPKHMFSEHFHVFLQKRGED